MARHRGKRRIHRDVSIPAGRARRLLPEGRARTAAAGTVPARVRRQDVAREPRSAATGEPVLLEAIDEGGGMIAKPGLLAVCAALLAAASIQSAFACACCTSIGERTDLVMPLNSGYVD